MKKLPFFSRSAQMTVVDLLCRCGGKWSEHANDDRGGEIHGGGHAPTGCLRFRYSGYMYEQAKIEHESIREEQHFEVPVGTTGPVHT